ncbi:TetR/AcrR family transcriptional regulator [Streptomyces sp. P38-E01]|uniref:TetR/AcrR family transcriptional regulator n=1 Tax=Streptomyces tardus TaxID=2780544 RepID=A0A949JDD5_9ACTN|nr:TetR/AcrR family transcriptional regulator [Streptomyces tardus]MBU7596938.1 TetR/AcrR family transcriptional regulator [Streptomyces tardus]
MGHREDLLAGAKRCLLEKGYARTTARDIVAASGTNLASIGYHYGSKNALMAEALFAATSDWGDDAEQALAAVLPDGAGRRQHFETGWTVIVDLFRKHRALWSAQMEAVLLADRDSALREFFATSWPESSTGLIALLNGVPAKEVTEEQRRVFGSLYMTLLGGLLLQQQLEHYPVPDGRDLAQAMAWISGAEAA